MKTPPSSKRYFGTFVGVESSVDKRRAQARAEHHVPLYTIAEMAPEFGITTRQLASMIGHAGIEPKIRHGSTARTSRRVYYDLQEVRRWWHSRQLTP